MASTKEANDPATATEPPKTVVQRLRKYIVPGLLLLALAVLVWWWMRPTPLPEAIVTGNGRIEATEIDIATKTPGRIVEILPYEGDFVQFGMEIGRAHV